MRCLLVFKVAAAVLLLHLRGWHVAGMFIGARSRIITLPGYPPSSLVLCLACSKIASSGFLGFELRLFQDVSSETAAAPSS